MASATTQHTHTQTLAKFCAFILWVICLPVIVTIGSLKYISKYHFTPTISLLLSGFIFIFNPIAALISSATASAWLVRDISRRNAFPQFARISLPLASFVIIGIFTPLLINSQYSISNQQSNFLYQSLVPSQFPSSFDFNTSESAAVKGIDIENLTVRYNDEFELCVTEGTELFTNSQEAFSSIEECNRYAIAKKQSLLIRDQITNRPNQPLPQPTGTPSLPPNTQNTTQPSSNPVTSDINTAAPGTNMNNTTGNSDGDDIEEEADDDSSNDNTPGSDQEPSSPSGNTNPIITDVNSASDPTNDEFILGS